MIDCSLCTAMVIGFTHRFQTVSESNSEDGEDFFPIYIPVATLRTAERVHPMLFCPQVSESTAIVISIDGPVDPLFDVVFGARNGYNNPIKIEFDLQELVDTIQPLLPYIKNDFRIEDEECFIICIFPVDFSGHHELFSCNEDNTGSTNYFCTTTKKMTMVGLWHKLNLICVSLKISSSI